MIIDQISKLKKYSKAYPSILILIDYLKSHKLEDMYQMTMHKNIRLIPINSMGVSENFDPNLLEAHREFMDIHITLSGKDIIGYKELSEDSNIVKDYEKKEDYFLIKSETINTLDVAAGYFCIIPNNFAHMALYKGHKNVKKLVIKCPVI